ncbi:MAG: hypothetical protein EBX40_04770 [Gammaproteobacteria bacterium]|nr:hypothetical protein [Gammaproteobacteria bacterium]
MKTKIALSVLLSLGIATSAIADTTAPWTYTISVTNNSVNPNPPMNWRQTAFSRTLNAPGIELNKIYDTQANTYSINVSPNHSTTAKIGTISSFEMYFIRNPDSFVVCDVVVSFDKNGMLTGAKQVNTAPFAAQNCNLAVNGSTVNLTLTNKNEPPIN